MGMTKLKLTVVTAVVAAGVAIPWVMQHQTETKLTAANEALRQQKQQVEQLALENARLARLAEKPAAAPAATNNPSLELLRLRGEVARLRQDVAARTNGPSALSGVKADPAMWKLLRDQQKAGMTTIYKSLGRQLKLSPEQTERLNDLLADNIMENIDHVTAALRDKLTPEQMEPIFAGQEAALLEKVQALLGADGLTQYQEYTRDLAALISAEQFKGKLTGDGTELQAKANQLTELLRNETKQVLANAGLPADYQMVPMLNFRNIASESLSERNLQLFNGIYEQTIAKAGSFLSPDELGKLDEFRKAAVNASRMTLTMNRKMMAPSGN